MAPVAAPPRPTPLAPDHGAPHAPYTSSWLALGVLTTIFFMWGFLTCLNDILIPHLKSIFQLNYAQAILEIGRAHV